jgi:hypothetical protein
MKKITKSLKLNKKQPNQLTFWASCAKLMLGYTGIVVYFGGQKSLAQQGTLDHQYKKQKQKISSNKPKLAYRGQNQLNSGFCQSGETVSAVTTLASKLNSLIDFLTFCFLPKRFFVEKTTLYAKIKNKIAQYHDSWLLSVTRHFARGGSQQNYADSLGRSGINPEGPERQSGVALLYQGTSGPYCPAGFGN